MSHPHRCIELAREIERRIAKQGIFAGGARQVELTQRDPEKAACWVGRVINADALQSTLVRIESPG